MGPQKRPIQSLGSIADCSDNAIPPNLSIASGGKESAFNKDSSNIWRSAAAAKFAAGMYVRTCRRLGIINRKLVTSEDIDLSSLRDSLFTESGSSAERETCSKKRKKETRRKIPVPTLSQAKSQILQLEDFQTQVELEQKAHRFQQIWKSISEKGAFDAGWDDNTGELTSCGPSISCHKLLRFMNQKRPLLWDDEDSHCNDDTARVLEAIVALMVPAPTLYNQPLVFTKATLVPIADSHKYQLSIGVYANRLLFECMTQELQIVMSALDESSFQVEQKIHEPPSTTLATNEFQSAEFPTLVFDSEDIHEEYDDEEEGAEISAKPDGKTLSAFTIPGFLKMIENTGTFDEDLWKKIIEPRLAQTSGGSRGLQTDLLLHQKHGVCWMYQMEHIGNLNRLIWEKRQFHEGDTYYYSPALGQVRLFLSEDADSKFETGWGGGGTCLFGMIEFAFSISSYTTADSLSQECYLMRWVWVKPFRHWLWCLQLWKMSSERLKNRSSDVKPKKNGN